MIMMMMRKDHSLDAKPFVLGISDKFQRLIARIYYVAVLSLSCADDVPVAFQIAAYKFFLSFWYKDRIKGCKNFSIC